MRVVFGFALAAVCAVASSRPSMPIEFEQNSGQTSSQVRYFGRAPGAGLWFLDSGAILRVNLKGREAVLRMTMDGAKRHPLIQGGQLSKARANYFIGNDESKWRTGLPIYGEVRYRDVYPGIDLSFHGSDRTLEYDWIVAPGADPNSIRMSFDGADRVDIDATGDLVLGMSDFQIRHKRPKLLQEGREVAGHFVRRGRSIGFEIASYDRTRPLIIDPVLTYASYLGGSESDSVDGVAIDAQGMLLILGSTDSINIPAKKGVFLSPPNSFGYPMVAKFNPAGQIGDSLVWLTFLGGNYFEHGTGLTTDKDGTVYVTGYTQSRSFPVKNAFQPNFATTFNCIYKDFNGADFQAPCADGFVSKISGSGDTLMFSSYVGGEADDIAYAIFVDPSGIVYVGGSSGSNTFNTTTTAYQRKLNGPFGGSCYNAFVAKVGPTGKLMYSTLVGGESFDFLSSIAVDGQGNIVLVGNTTSSAKFPVMKAFQAARSGTQDGFIVELNTSQAGPAQLIYSTFLGGASGGTTLKGAIVDKQGKVYVVGGTTSAQYPVTAASSSSPSALLPRLNATPDPKDPNTLGFTQDAVISELNPALTGAAQLVYSAYLGGSGYDQANAVTMDSAGKLLVVGGTDSPDFPVTPDGFQQVYSFAPFSPTAFIAKIDPNPQAAAHVLYGSYLGIGFEQANAVALDATSMAVVGTAYADNFPVTAGAFQKKFGGGGVVGSAKILNGDGFITRFDTTKAGAAITAATNAASFAGAGPGAAPGEMVTFFGSNLGPESLVGAVLDSNGKLPTTIEGCQVLADGTPAPIVYVWTKQTSVILPYELTPKIGKDPIFAQIVCNGVAGNLFPLKIVESAPGIFSAGNGQAAVLNADGSANSAANPAAKGSLVQIFATGEGVLSPAGVDGRIETGPVASIPKPVLPVSVTFGGLKSGNLPYFGVAPSAVDGLLQVNAEIPKEVGSGPVEIVLIVGSGKSPKGLNIAVK